MAAPIRGNASLKPSARELEKIDLEARLVLLCMTALAMVLTSISLETITRPIAVLNCSALTSALAQNSVDISALTVVSVKATTSRTESLTMADVATSVVLVVLLSAAASMDMVLMDVVMIPSTTMARSVASTHTVNSLLSSAMSVTLKILVVHVVSQASKASKPTSTTDQDSPDLLAVEASTMAFVDSVMSVPIRTLVASVASAMSKRDAVSTSDMASKVLMVLAVAMQEFTLALAVTVVPEPASMAPVTLLEPKATLSDALVENSSTLVSPAAELEEVSDSKGTKLFQEAIAKPLSSVSTKAKLSAVITVTATTATVTTAITVKLPIEATKASAAATVVAMVVMDGEYYTEKVLSFKLFNRKLNHEIKFIY